MPIRPTFLASWICEMPDTTVQKMIGAITILISLMKPSPSALTQSLVARPGSSQPNSAPITIAISTWTYKTLYQGVAARRAVGVAVTAVMTSPPLRSALRDCLSLPADNRPVLFHSQMVRACRVNGAGEFFVPLNRSRGSRPQRSALREPSRNTRDRLAHVVG